MINVGVVLLGDTYPLDVKKLNKLCRQSSLFSITLSEMPNAALLDPNTFNALTDHEISGLAIDNSETDFSIVVVNRPLQANYFSRPISEKLIAVSVHDLDALNIHDGVTLEKYLARFIYGFATIYKAFNNALPSNSAMVQARLMQDRKGCLFDKCMYKPHVALFFKQPKLSVEAIAVLRTKTLPRNYIETLEKEIKWLRIGKYFIIRDSMSFS